jgi:Protein of unknown function (DUF2934)
MSRSTTSTAAAPQTAKGMQATATMPTGTPHHGLSLEKVAARAYQKWMQKGCKHGNDQQDWLEAEAELKAEMARTKK